MTSIEGAISKKVYMHYDEGDEAGHLTLKMTVPSKWASRNVDALKEFFVEHYNSKKPDNQLNPAEFHMEKKANTILYGDDLLHHAIAKYDDLFLRPGVSPMKPVKSEVFVSEDTKGSQNLLQCKNFGCQKKFNEEENNDTACHHHPQPPTFHDMKKGWSCCGQGKMVYDWDDFEKLPTCVIGRHNANAPDTLFAKSPTVLAAERASANESSSTPAPTLKSIDDYNKKNPEAKTAVSSAIEASRTSTASGRTDGKAKCVNFGCQVEYTVSENKDTSCVHHAGAPVFHDAGKYWSCCPKNVKYDFDAFLKIPGCVTSKHRDVKV